MSGPTTGPQEVHRWTPFGQDVEGWQIWLGFFLVLGVVSAVLRYLTFRPDLRRHRASSSVPGCCSGTNATCRTDRIQNLDATRSLLHRVFGVAEVRVETGGGQEPEARISVLRETEFEEMRRRVFEGRTRAAHTSASTA